MQRQLLFLAYLFLCANVIAQQYPLFYYTPNDGLINSRVRNVKQDSKGRLFFLTYGGLSIFDGVRFSNYRLHEGLADELVNDVLEVTPDSFLIATNTNRLNTLTKGVIGSFETSDHFCPLVNHFLKSEDGHIYASSDQGFFLFSHHKFTRLPFSKLNGKSIDYNLDNFVEWNGYFLIVPWQTNQNPGLILFNRNTKSVADTYKTGVFSVVKDRNGRVWVSYPLGIRILDTTALNKGKIQFTDPPGKFKALRNREQTFIFFDSRNNLWLCSNNRVEKISPEFQLETIASEKSLNSGGNLMNIFEDREHLIWLATDGGGVIKIKGTDLQFVKELASVPLQAPAIRQSGDTTWIFNSTNNSICRLVNNTAKVFLMRQKLHVAGNILIIGNKLYIDDQHRILCISNKNTPSAYLHPTTILDLHSIEYSFGDGIVDKYGSIIQVIAQNNALYYLIVIRNDKVVMRRDIRYIPDYLVTDKPGNLWLVTRDNHLMSFSLHPGEPTEYLHLEKDYIGRSPIVSPRSITMDTSDHVWIGTRNDGLLKLELNGDQVKIAAHLTTTQGLTDNFVYTLHCDAANNIWAGTQTGLDKISFRDGHYIVSNISKSNNFFQAIQRIVSADARTVWVLTRGGTLFRIVSSETMLPEPPLVLINLSKVNGNGGIGNRFQFPHSQNNLVFEVACPSFIDEKAVRFSYLMQGSGNTQWSDPSREATLNFINLAPGKYTLLVRAKFPDAMYPEQQNSYSFSISLPWWQTWWFRTGVLLLISLVVFLVARSLFRRKFLKQKQELEKKQAVEKERTRIATDMHDDLGAGLSRIKFLSETIGMKKQMEQPVDEEITSIRQYANEMIAKMGEIVWALNEKNDSLHDLLAYCRSYAVEYLTENGIPCQVDMPEQIAEFPVSSEIRRNVYLVIKEILHNIVKHAQATRVSIRILTGDRLSVAIEDNGAGFDKNKIGLYSNGISNMKKRIQELGGEFHLHSEGGTLIEFSIPLGPRLG